MLNKQTNERTRFNKQTRTRTTKTIRENVRTYAHINDDDVLFVCSVRNVTRDDEKRTNERMFIMMMFCQYIANEQSWLVCVRNVK